MKNVHYGETKRRKSNEWACGAKIGIGCLSTEEKDGVTCPDCCAIIEKMDLTDYNHQYHMVVEQKKLEDKYYGKTM